MSEYKNKRRPFLKRFWIHASFQARYSFFVVGVTTLITAVFSYLYYKNELSKSQFLAIQSSEITDFISSGDSKILSYLALFLLLQFVMVLFLGVILTHRVAGPIHRLKDYFNYLADGGKPRKIGGFRTHDEFKDFFEAVNRYNNGLMEQDRNDQ